MHTALFLQKPVLDRIGEKSPFIFCNFLQFLRPISRTFLLNKLFQTYENMVVHNSNTCMYIYLDLAFLVN